MFDDQYRSYQENRKASYEKFKVSHPTSSYNANETTLLYQAHPPERVYVLGTGLDHREPDRGCCCCRSSGCESLGYPECSPMPDNSYKVFTLPVLGGVALHIHRLWLIFLIISCLGALQLSVLFAVYSFLIGGPVLFSTVLIHELGHATMAVYLGGTVSRILLWPLGGLAYISFFGESNPKADALVAVAGPLTHIPMILVWMGLMAASTGGTVSLSWPLRWGYDLWVSVCAGAITTQIVLCLFNLIPAYPLDGGRLFGALLQHMKVDRNLAFQISAALGGGIGGYMLMVSLQSIFAGQPSYFGGWNLLCLSVFILYNCYELWKLGRRGIAAQHPGFDNV